MEKRGNTRRGGVGGRSLKAGQQHDKKVGVQQRRLRGGLETDREDSLNPKCRNYLSNQEQCCLPCNTELFFPLIIIIIIFIIIKPLLQKTVITIRVTILTIMPTWT